MRPDRLGTFGLRAAGGARAGGPRKTWAPVHCGESMRRLPAVTASLFFVTVLSGAWCATAAQGAAGLEGGWLVNSWTAPGGDVDAEPQRGLFMFTSTGQYSMMYVLGDEGRPRYAGETQTDEEVLRAYASFVANSGRYVVDRDRITFEAYVAKDPNYMDDWNLEGPGNEVVVTFSISDGILTLTWIDGIAAGRSATLRRPGQA